MLWLVIGVLIALALAVYIAVGIVGEIKADSAPVPVKQKNKNIKTVGRRIQ
jgi:hypothetical protein